MANDVDDDSTSRKSLPIDVIEIILLSDLPVKSLLRFKAVSKSWNNLISSPRFIKSHLQRSKMNSASQLLFLAQKFPGRSYRVGFHWHYPLLRLEDGEFHTESVLDLPAVFLNCYCDGLVLCSGASRTYVLWNPSCRRHTRVYYPYKDVGTCGLCRDPVTNDVKIVDANGKYYGVYSCIAKSWVRKEFCHTGYACRSSGLSVDGAVYWAWFRPDFGGPQDIVCFDSRDDTLKVMEKPKVVGDTDPISLLSFKDTLCACFYNRGASVLQIWCWNRTSWTQFMTIEPVPAPFRFLRPLCFKEDMILIQVDTARFLIYRPIEQTFEEFEDENMKEIVGIVPYMESLEFIPVQRALPHRKRKPVHSK